MRIHHIAVWTFRLEEMKDFYVRYFKGKSNNKYINPKKGFESYFIRFDDGAHLELMSRTDVQNIPIEENRLGLTHFAFGLNSKEEVLDGKATRCRIYYCRRAPNLRRRLF